MCVPGKFEGIFIAFMWLKFAAGDDSIPRATEKRPPLGTELVTAPPVFFTVDGSEFCCMPAVKSPLRYLARSLRFCTADVSGLTNLIFACFKSRLLTATKRTFLCVLLGLDESKLDILSLL